MGFETTEVSVEPPDPSPIIGPSVATVYDIATGTKVGISPQRPAGPEASRSSSAGFDTTGGGGDDGGMDRIENLERSVKRLEDDFGSVKSDVNGMRNDMSEIRITLGELNSKLNINDIRQNVEKAHTDIYKWLATVVVSVAAGGIAIYTGLKSSGSNSSATPSVQYVVPLPAPVAPPASALPPTAPPAQSKQ